MPEVGPLWNDKRGNRIPHTNSVAGQKVHQVLNTQQLWKEKVDWIPITTSAQYSACFGSTCTKTSAQYSKFYYTTNRRQEHTTYEGPVRIQYKCLVLIYVFPEMKLRNIIISKTEL